MHYWFTGASAAIQFFPNILLNKNNVFTVSYILCAFVNIYQAHTLFS